jgi:hypothetical protein
MDPLIGFALDHAEYAPVHHLECVGFEGDQGEQEPIFGCREGAVVVDGKPARSPRFPIHPPCRHPGVEHGLERRDELLKRVERHARQIQEFRGAGL